MSEERGNSGGKDILSKPVHPLVPIAIIVGFVAWGVHGGAFKSPLVAPAAVPGAQAMKRESPVSAIAFVPARSEVVVGRRDGTLEILEVPSQASRRKLDTFGGAVRALALSNDGKWLAVSADRVRLYSLGSSAAARDLGENPEFAISLRFSADGSQLLALGHDAQFWAPSQPQAPKARREIPDLYTASALSPGLDTIATHHTNAVNLGIALWDASSGKLKARLPCMNWSCEDLEFSASGKMLAAAAYQTTLLYGMPDGREAGRLTGHADRVSAVSWRGDDRLAAGGVDGTVQIWDVPARRILATLPGPPDPIGRIEWSSAGDRLAVVTLLGVLRFADVPPAAR
ncbi:MAG: hypothetical protein HYY25_05635 [Candidatus Wallbacteria bacterium]|nr:hypothetical protein [Candidatus Wallbacteria bacterium]